MIRARRQTEKKTHLFDNPRHISVLLYSLYTICIILFLLDFIVHRHTSHAWEDISGFYAIFGFIACVSLVLIAKLLRKILKRREDYYHVDD